MTENDRLTSIEVDSEKDEAILYVSIVHGDMKVDCPTRHCAFCEENGTSQMRDIESGEVLQEDCRNCGKQLSLKENRSLDHLHSKWGI